MDVYRYIITHLEYHFQSNYHNTIVFIMIYFRFFPQIQFIELATKSFRFFMIFKASSLIKITKINRLFIGHFVR